MTNLNIEAEVAASIARTMLLPASAQHLSLLHSAQLPELASETESLISELSVAIKALARPTSRTTSRTTTYSSTPNTCGTR